MDHQDFRQKSQHVPFAREGLPYVIGAAFVTLIVALLGDSRLAWLLLGCTLFVGHFFRDPQRVVCAGEGEVVAPADGKVVAIERVTESNFLQKPCLRISIFLSVFDVHVNRIPYTGLVQGLQYQKGNFLAANRSKSSQENEQARLWLRTDSGEDLVVVQIAGFIARRIVCWPNIGDRVFRGERFGMIRFGSRTDLYVPEASEVLVGKGDRVRGGETLLCRLTSKNDV